MVAAASLAHAGLISGTGYAPFHGGPLTCLNGINAKTAQEAPSRMSLVDLCAALRGVCAR